MPHFDKVYRQNMEKIFMQERPMEEMPGFVKILKKEGMKRVLDHGCGSGRHTVYLAGLGFDVCAFDISGVGVRKTRDWLKRSGLNARLTRHDIYRRLPYRDGQFDAVVSIRTIGHNWRPQVKRAFADINRVTRKGGYLFLQIARTPATFKDFSKKPPTMFRYRRLAKNTYAALEGAEEGLVHYFPTRADLTEMLRGYRILDIHMNKPRLHYIVLARKIR